MEKKSAPVGHSQKEFRQLCELAPRLRQEGLRQHKAETPKCFSLISGQKGDESQKHWKKYLGA
jgi:hypothetical protein